MNLGSGDLIGCSLPAGAAEVQSREAASDGMGWACVFKPLSTCPLPIGAVPTGKVVHASLPSRSTRPSFYTSSHSGPYSGIVPPRAAAILAGIPNLRNESYHTTWVASAIAFLMKPNQRTLIAMDERRHLCPKASELNYAVHIYVRHGDKCEELAVIFTCTCPQ